MRELPPSGWFAVAFALIATACIPTSGTTTSTLDVTPTLPTVTTTSTTAPDVVPELRLGDGIDVDFALVAPETGLAAPSGYTYRPEGQYLVIEGPNGIVTLVGLLLRPILSPDVVSVVSVEQWLTEYYRVDGYEIIELTPVRIGAVDGVMATLRFSWVEEGESGTDWRLVAAAADETYLYSTGCGTFNSEGALGAFTPHCEAVLASLQVPIPMTDPEPPELAGGWFIESGEILVSGPDGLTIYNPGTGEVRTIAEVPMARAFGQADGVGLVFQPALGDRDEGASHEPVWWRAGPLGAAGLVHQPDPFSKSELYGVVDLGDGPAALIRLHAYQNDDLWVAQPLDGGPWREIGFLSGGELAINCAAWTGQDLLLATVSHGSSDIGRVTPSGEWSPFLPAGICVAMGPGELVTVLVQRPGEPAELLTADLEGTVRDSVVLDDRIEDAVALDVDPGGNVVVSTIAGDIYLVDPSTGAVELLPVRGSRAGFVR